MIEIAFIKTNYLRIAPLVVKKEGACHKNSRNPPVKQEFEEDIAGLESDTMDKSSCDSNKAENQDSATRTLNFICEEGSSKQKC